MFHLSVTQLPVFLVSKLRLKTGFLIYIFSVFFCRKCFIKYVAPMGKCWELWFFTKMDYKLWLNILSNMFLEMYLKCKALFTWRFNPVSSDLDVYILISSSLSFPILVIGRMWSWSWFWRPNCASVYSSGEMRCSSMLKFVQVQEALVKILLSGIFKDP